MRRLFLMAAALIAAGCSFTRSEPLVYHVWRDPGVAAPAPPARPAGATLLVAPPAADSFYDTTAIAFSRAEGTRSHYQYAQWTERPGRALQGMLVARLEAAGLFAAVAPSTAGVAGALELDVRLHALYHDAAAAPGMARVRLTAQLVDRGERRLVAQRTFERSAPASAYSAAGAVDGFNAAVGGVLDELTGWLRSVQAAGR
jgi:cholesterol transport system auxiliary component